MALDKYQEKRNFSKTPEPSGGKAKGDKLVFVVQKHAASHLHYDFRLELKGVLKSWAVPKGPSLDPKVQRLAQAVEDHPYDYKDFEGIIPKGQYGGGTVIIWDQGTYEPAEKIKGKKEQEHWLASHYYKSTLRIRLNGKKLKGEFLLVRTKERGENAWLLTKVDDKYASEKDVTEKDKSVVSGLSIEEMAANENAAVWQSNRELQENSPGEKQARQADPKGKKAPFPTRLEPMLCTLTREPFTDPDWLYEVKFDGYRIITYKAQDKVILKSRKLDFTKKFPLLVEEIKQISHDLVMDGELVVVDEKGLPDFDALPKYREGMDLRYYVFDLLYFDGYDLSSLPLEERREILLNLLPESGLLHFSRDFEDGEKLYQAVKAQAMEGIIAKRRDSTYLPGKRSSSWLKIPVKKTQDFVIGAWTESESGKAFRSLIFGNYVNGVFTYVGHVGHGFKETERKEILEKLKPLEIMESPFSNEVETETKVHWIKPELVATIEFATWTAGGNIRKPATFKGWRPDKEAKEVVPEEPLEGNAKQQLIQAGRPDEEQQEETELPQETLKDEEPGKETSELVYANEDSNWKELDKLEKEGERELPVEGYQVKVYDLAKVLWSEEGINKAQLMSYYASMAPHILPYLKNRPLSLYLKHISPTAPGLYIKDMEGRQPEFAEVFATERKHKKKGKRNIIEYLVCNNAATLLYLINLGAIDLNPWSSRTSSPESPDYITIDLDPSDGDFGKAVECAIAAKEVFGEHKLKAFLKTSGKTGLHLLLPCSGFNFAEARSLGSLICDEVQKLVPEISTRERSVEHRGNKLYVDDSQNDFADTIASVYSVRPYHIPTVSTPVEWKELKSSLDPARFTIHTIQERLKEKGDLWANLQDPKIIKANNQSLSRLLKS